MNREEARELIKRHSYKDESGRYVISKKVAFIIADCLENNNIQDTSCENCKHFRSGKQPDGIDWQECEYHFQCKTCFDDFFEEIEK